MTGPSLPGHEKYKRSESAALVAIVGGKNGEDTTMMMTILASADTLEMTIQQSVILVAAKEGKRFWQGNVFSADISTPNPMTY